MTETNNNPEQTPQQNTGVPVPPPPPAPEQQAPQQGGYAAPQQQPAAAGENNNLMLNYWLSVFFTWLPALIFWLIDKDKGNAKLNYFNVENLNFSLLRTAVGLASFIPYIGWVVAFLGGIALFVLHLMAAIKAKNEYDQNGGSPFMFNIPLIKHQ